MKPIVTFTETAASKIMATIMSNTQEVGFYGAATRDAELAFTVDEIKLYPQLVSGAHISLDTKAYSAWAAELDDDFYDRRRFHGHSHVNMGVAYSGIDMNDQHEILKDLEPDDFYIFAVFNKNFQINISVIADTLRYDEVDVVWPESVREIFEQNKEMVKPERITYNPTPSNWWKEFPTFFTPHTLKEDDESEEDEDWLESIFDEVVCENLINTLIRTVPAEFLTKDTVERLDMLMTDYVNSDKFLNDLNDERMDYLSEVTDGLSLESEVYK